jgi:nudix-type nucleoside diphosphatase (YffH/AdpP family)
MKPVILNRSTAYAGYLSVEKFELRLRDGATVLREVESHGDAVAILPYDAARRVALVAELFRAPVFTATGADQILEACAGMIDDEEPTVAARREALEELGVRLGELELVARVWSSPGVSTERQTLFLAPYVIADRIAPGGGVADEHEGITVIEHSLAELWNMVADARIVDAKLLTLVMALRWQRPHLFVPIDP